MNTAFCLHQFILKLCLWYGGGRKSDLSSRGKQVRSRRNVGLWFLALKITAATLRGSPSLRIVTK